MLETKEVVKIQTAPVTIDKVTIQCPVCADPRRADIDTCYNNYRQSAKYTARRFKLPVSWIKNHASHVKIVTSVNTHADRIKSKANALWGWATTSAAGGEMDIAARIAETARRYDEMLLKIEGAPGFTVKEPEAKGARIQAPGSKFVIVQGTETPSLD